MKSAGNEGVSLDLPKNVRGHSNDQIFLQNLSDTDRDKLILVGNLENGNAIAYDSNKPGSDPKIHDHFIWTLGSDVLSYVESDKYDAKTGTSMAAPIVSGAAALVKGQFPGLSHKEVKECLLESARKDFLVEKDGKTTHIVAPGKPVDLSKNEVPFNKHLWGKGILDVERALEYAYIKTNHPELSSDRIRAILDKRDEIKEKAAATKIQRAFRKKR